MVHLFKIAGTSLLIVPPACNRAPPGPTPTPAVVQTGVASFYGREFAGRETASGEPLRLGAMTAASRTLPLGTRVQVVNTETGETARVTINDRGPYAEGRVLDLTPAAARTVGIDREEGVAPVAIRPIPPEQPVR